MLNDPPKEPAAKVAERKWRNNQLRQKFKENKLPINVLVDPECIDYENHKVHLKKEAPQEPAQVIENEDPRITRFETKFKKDIRAMMEGHKKTNMERHIFGLRVSIHYQKRRLLLEKMRRLEASIAQREGARS